MSLNTISYRLTLTALVITVKFYDDNFYENKIYAKFGGISTKELAFLEKEFLKMIDFDLMVDRDTFDKFYKNMNK